MSSSKLHENTKAHPENVQSMYIRKKFYLLSSKPVADKSPALFVCAGHFMRTNQLSPNKGTWRGIITPILPRHNLKFDLTLM